MIDGKIGGKMLPAGQYQAKNVRNARMKLNWGLTNEFSRIQERRIFEWLTDFQNHQSKCDFKIDKTRRDAIGSAHDF
jgi:hypothetical protein